MQGKPNKLPKTFNIIFICNIFVSYETVNSLKAPCSTFVSVCYVNIKYFKMLNKKLK